MIVMVAKNLNFFQQMLFSPTVEEVTKLMGGDSSGRVAR